MSTSAYRRCRREQLAWRFRHEIRATLADPGVYRYIATVLATSAIVVSLWVGVR